MLYTEEAVRAGLRVRDGRRVFYLPEGSRLTPAARDWLRQEGVTVVPHAETPPAAYRTPDGAAFAEKPEHMTHLRGNILVPKTHPRIAFRGGIDTLEAELLLCAQAADGPLRQTLCAMLDFVRSLIRADVLDEPVQAVRFLGLDGDGLREHSHHPEAQPPPGARGGPAALSPRTGRSAHPAAAQPPAHRRAADGAAGLPCLFCPRRHPRPPRSRQGPQPSVQPVLDPHDPGQAGWASVEWIIERGMHKASRFVIARALCARGNLGKALPICTDRRANARAL